MNEPNKEALSQNINIPIDWHVPNDFQSQYASNVFVQAGEYEIIISFFQAQLPILAGTPEENIAKIRELGAIQANCVGRMIVNPELVPKIINVLQDTLDKYRAAKEQNKE